MKRHDSTWALVVALALMLAGLAVAASAQSTARPDRGQDRQLQLSDRRS